MGEDDLIARLSDVRRLRALSATRLLDSTPEEAYDRLTRLCSELIGSPVAVVSVIDEKRQFIKSAAGLGGEYAETRVAPLSHSFCKYVVASGQPLVVEDARESPLLRDNPAIRDSGVIAYAGVPLTSAGEAIGAFCALDGKPRSWTDGDVRLLNELARSVEAHIELRIAHAALMERERTLDTILTTMPAGVLISDMRGAVLRSNTALERLLGRSSTELLSTDIWEITHPDDVAGDRESRQALVSDGRTTVARTKRYRHADGHYVWVRLSASVLRDAEDHIEGTVAVVEDVSAERAAQEALARQVTEERRQARELEHANALFEATLANIHDGVVVLDHSKRVVLANSAYADFLNLPIDQAIGLTRARFLEHASNLVEDREAFVRAIEQPEPGPAGDTSEFVLVRPRRRRVRRTIAPLELPDGRGYLVVWHDMTAEAELLAERERLALTDPLTGIANRRAGEHALAKAIAQATRASTPLSIAMFDIDHFKRVNDLYGHAAGDEVLRRVAHALESAKRLTDTVCRWGGEEFLAVLPVSLEGAVAFCERVRQDVANLRCPGIGQVTISAGVATLAPEEGQEALLARADQRLYFAKSSGRNRVES